ncbi:MAG TPA: GAF domain-containing protein [Melioribacteraceae bacterium]|nr:GAF domain-containing protein [Melioribacteraceae bacterium]
MSESININKDNSDEEIYRQIIPQIESLINPAEPLISSLANVTAALKEAFDKISWVGFYLLNDDRLYLGPFQGKVACTVIELGKGVCGTSALKKETLIVADVHEFPGHIACDGGSNSEIVVPLIKDDKVFGVLDLDSYNFSAFNNTDKINLENLCNLLVNKLGLNYQKPIIN